jgi:homoserine O-acetyltransferase/O-succinyltransferase
VLAERALADALGVARFAAVVGGSMGGMRVLEWMVGYPDRVAAALVLAVGPRATADQIGTQTTQIAAIKADPDWQGGDYHGTGRSPIAGLGVARRIAHLTYRTSAELDTRFANDAQTGEDPRLGGRYAVQSYLEHQADKLIARFDPATYVLLTEAMNRHDVGRGRGGWRQALAATAVPAVVAGIDSDRLYPLHTQAEIADALPDCSGLDVISSHYGHDGFLTEAAQVGDLLRRTMDLAKRW